MKILSHFKQFKDKGLAEYYLIGTLLSLMFGIIFSILIKKFSEKDKIKLLFTIPLIYSSLPGNSYALH